MESLPTVILKPGEAERVLAGHPWVYAGSILRLVQPVLDGAVVQVKDHRSRFLGIGFYNSKSKIHVRILDCQRVTVDQRFFEGRIRTALALRQKHLPRATSFRVVNAESDLLSGLTVDKYEDVLVLQTTALGMDQRKPMIVSALQGIFSPRAILERNELASRKFEGLPDASGLLAGSLAHESPSDQPSPSGTEPSPAAAAVSAKLWAEINGLRFEVDLLQGHKTGLYLDQQVNYLRVADLAKDGQVLDCFCFAGGFALHAARAGAAHVHAIDQAQSAVEMAERNAVANGLREQCSFEGANVFNWLKAETTTPPHEKLIPRFDLIILDPPSFTRNRAAVLDALRGFKEIHLRALKLLKPGGTLATFCCSHHVDAQLFQETILEAAFDVRRLLRRVATFTQSPDHPIIPAIPETEYLKGYAFEVIR